MLKSGMIIAERYEILGKIGTGETWRTSTRQKTIS